MGKIQRFSTKVIVRLGVEEVLGIRAATAENIAFTIEEFISWFASAKAQEKKVILPRGVCVTTYDPKQSEFVVTFANKVEDGM